jgi:hypothetical protein
VPQPDTPTGADSPVIFLRDLEAKCDVSERVFLARPEGDTPLLEEDTFLRVPRDVQHGVCTPDVLTRPYYTLCVDGCGSQTGVDKLASRSPARMPMCTSHLPQRLQTAGSSCILAAVNCVMFYMQ